MSDPARPDLLARIRPLGRSPVDGLTVLRAEAAERRHSERRPFRSEPVPDRFVDALVAAGVDDGVYAYAVRSADERLDLAVVFSWADSVEAADPAYRAELAHWTRHRDEDAPDGVPAEVVPHAAAGSPRHTDVAMRDFEVGITGGQDLVELVDEKPTQATDLTALRERLRTLMDWPDHPQLVLRVGWPPSAAPPPLTNRRPLSDVLTFEG